MNRLWSLTVILIALNLRPFLTAVGPLAPIMQAEGAISLDALAWLTLLPMMLMGVGTWLAPAVQRRIGARRAIGGALALLAVGSASRLFPELLVSSAVLCGLGAAIIQGVLPGLIKLHAAPRLALMMGIYSAALMGGGAIGAQLTPLALDLTSWNVVLAAWGIPPLIALLFAWPRLAGAPLPGSRLKASTTAWLLARPRSWFLLLAFGLMNGGYAIMVAWMAPHYQVLGLSAARSGWLIAIVSAVAGASALGLPALARRSHDRRPWLWLTLALQASGFFLLAWQPLAAPELAAAVLGAGLGGCFSFFMLVSLEHLDNPLAAGALNALMQGGGYFLSALAPWLMTRLHALTGSFFAGWWLQFATVLLVGLMVARLAPQGYAAAMRPPAGAANQAGRRD